MTPGELLSRAADLIRDSAASAVPAPWESNVCDVWFQGPYEAEMVADCGDARTAKWVALLSPAVAPAIEAWLRDAAEAAKDYEYWLVIPPWVQAAADFAVSVLGEEVHDGR